MVVIVVKIWFDPFEITSPTPSRAQRRPNEQTNHQPTMARLQRQRHRRQILQPVYSPGMKECPLCHGHWHIRYGGFKKHYDACLKLKNIEKGERHHISPGYPIILVTQAPVVRDTTHKSS